MSSVFVAYYTGNGSKKMVWLKALCLFDITL